MRGIRKGSRLQISAVFISVGDMIEATAYAP